MKKVTKKLATVLMAFVMVASVNCLVANAATVPWSLRYIAHAPTSSNVTSWSTMTYTTKSTTTMNVSQVGGGSEIMVYTSNGIGSIFGGAGSTSVSTVPGVRVYSSVSFSSYGSYNSSPSGSYSY